MKSLTVTALVLACVLRLTNCYAEEEREQDVERTQEQINAAKDFGVEGMNFTNTTPQTIRNKWASAARYEKECDAKIGWETWRVDKTANTDGIDFSFVNGKLESMWVWYFRQRIDKMGGFEVFPKRITDKLGKPDKGQRNAEEGELLRFDWVIPEASRFIRLIWYKDQKTTLYIVDRNLRNALEEKQKASANTGF